ncbi:CHAT domain-containing protein [Myxococcus xanthus]|uniref:CHAT domain-containing protein n=1 Tax=Myxococcus xanthus TaxID=34 RepID=A0A7Y4IJN9_MYXXA|nr:CHAT domain-containing protein [Myxococcus xanthus]NOJ80507.1 CHAT domain-containing protein [Myxococcus xanthus]NOJ84374.1 CHAT domain-containing protein [Myxococcus xanthus]
MSSVCDNLERFVDGEMLPADAENFRHHLARCAACESRMKELVALELLADDALNSPGPERLGAPSTWRNKSWLMVVPLALAAGLAALVLVPQTQPTDSAPGLWLAEAATRPLEVRLTHPGADGHRPYQVMRSGAGARPQALALRELARLEEAADHRGIASAFLLRGDLAQASAFLDKLPASADLDTDRAALALQQDEPEKALVLLERALKRKPRHAQALWNQALALQRLGLSLRAAESFEQVARLGERGWSDEAAQRAQALRSAAEQERKDWKGMRQDCQRMVDGGAPLSTAQAEALPGMARVCLYNALRAAASPERVESLHPLAVALDRKEDGTHLEDALRRTARRDFSARASLAREYARLTRGEVKGPALESFLSRLREARQEDLLLGALAYADPRQFPDEYRALALETKDPWFALLAEERQARADALADAPQRARERLQAAVKTCTDSGKQQYRCMLMQRELGLVMARLHRPVDARARFVGALRAARDSREWGSQRNLLQDLGQVARTQGDLVLARAYVEELLLQTPEGCADSEVALTSLALAHHRALDVAGARELLDRAIQCSQKPSMARLALLADLARTPFSKPEDTRLLEQGLAALRDSGTQDAGDLALLRHIEGRFYLEQDARRGQALLRQALANAAMLPAANVSARKARVYSYTSLILDAGRTGELAQGLALFAEERAMPAPERCVLGVTVDDERTFVVARDSEGRILGHHDAGRKAPLEGVDGLVPDAMVKALRACPSVDVLARPPVQGRAGLLPPDIAWSYRVSGLPVSPPSQAKIQRLIVTDVLAPASLHLPTLRAWDPASDTGEDLTLLRGAAATPPRVLAAMREATEVQVHAHGIIDPSVADASVLVLSPEAPGGRFALTTGDLKGQRLRGRPVVLLAACYAGHTSAYLHENFGLPLAFIESGARAVLAATQEIPDDEAHAFFEPVLARIRDGIPAAVALRDERQAWLRRHASAWVQQVLLFE